MKRLVTALGVLAPLNSFSQPGVGFNPSRTQAVFYIDHFCGLCGGGRYVLMEKIYGA
jgi:hypothetical protein